MRVLDDGEMEEEQPKNETGKKTFGDGDLSNEAEGITGRKLGTDQMGVDLVEKKN